jgi:uracil-DNA glycosylase
MPKVPFKSPAAQDPSPFLDLISSMKPGWKNVVDLNSPAILSLASFLHSEWKSGATIYPPRESIFRVFQELDLEEVRVVILGQDPYHGPDQAIGRAFGVPNVHFPKPPSLQNIFKELRSDLGFEIQKEGYSDLSGWSAQGVLLLNTVMTVRAGEAFSHRDQGWEEFTTRVIESLNAREKPLVFILWGSAAIQKKRLLDLKKHVAIESPHPSPLSSYRGFFGSKPFSKTNRALESFRENGIQWDRVSTGPEEV